MRRRQVSWCVGRTGKRGKGREGKGREGKGREGKGRGGRQAGSGRNAASAGGQASRRIVGVCLEEWDTDSMECDA